MTLYMCIVAITIFSVSHLLFLPVLQCRPQDPLVSAEAIGGRKILLNNLSALKATVMSLWLSPDSVDLQFNEEVMKPERFTEAPDHTGFNPDNMRVSSQKTTHNGDVSHFSSFFRTSDT